MPLAGAGIEEAVVAAFPGEGARRRQGEVGEQHEEGERNLGTLSVGLGVAGAGAPAEHREQRRRLQRAAALRCERRGKSRPGSFTAP